MIKVIAFDYAEVVAEGPMAKWIRENPDSNDERHAAFREHSHKWDVGEMAVEQVNKILSEITRIAPEKIWEKLYEKSLPNKEVIDLIRKLKKEYKIILFSNFVGELLRKLLAHYKITDLFDEIIISSEHKLMKPDPKFFETLVKKAGIKKTEILFTDDKKENVDAANAFGIKAFQFINAQQLIKDLKSAGVRI